MGSSYSQTKAMLAITKASLISIFRSPQAVFFSLFFPIVLIIVFGALSGGRGISFDLAFDHKSDTTNFLYNIIKDSVPVFNIKKGTEAELEDQLKKGRLAALIDIRKSDGNPSSSLFDLHLKTSSASQRDLPVLRTILVSILDSVNKRGA